MDIEAFINQCREIGKSYMKAKAAKEHPEINPFIVVSDLYRRENFHSDIIAELLKPQGSHREGNLFLDLFIDALNQEGASIQKSYYQNASVERESGKIDILIKSSSKEEKHCIIIENKLNDAGDMERQLPRYFDSMHDQNYEVDRIVYIPLYEKEPNTDTWQPEDIKNIEKRLYIMSADKLIKNWLLLCWQSAKRFNSTAFLKQYVDLLKFLIKDNMDNQELNEFYDFLCHGDNKERAIAVSDMLKEIPNFMRQRLYDYYFSDEKRKALFKDIEKIKGDDEDCKYGISFYNVLGTWHGCVEVWVSLNGYKVSLWLGEENSQNNALYILREAPVLNNFEKGQALNNLVAYIHFGKEDDVKKLLKDLFEALKKI